MTSRSSRPRRRSSCPGDPELAAPPGDGVRGGGGEAALTAVGDAVAGLGGNPEVMDRVITALGQIKAKGKTTAEEMMQLTEAGIPAWQLLADAIGMSIPEAMAQVTAGAIDADTVIGAVTTGMNAKFGGMMEKQSHTFGGLLDGEGHLYPGGRDGNGAVLRDGNRRTPEDGGLHRVGRIHRGYREVRQSPKRQRGPGIRLIQAFMAAASGEGVTSDGIFGVVERAGVILHHQVIPAMKDVVGWIKDFVSQKGNLIAVGGAIAALFTLGRSRRGAAVATSPPRAPSTS